MSTVGAGGPRQRVRVRVPASAANLGPGFDSLALALALYDHVRVDIADRGVSVEVHGQGEGEVPTDEQHLVVKALRAAAEQLALPLPGVRLRCDNAIPHARGLGSSAAAVVAGIAAAYGLAGKSLDVAALRMAAGLEGHADNAAAALYGGLVVAWADPGGYRACTLEPAPQLHPVALVPHTTSSTVAARRLLPELVPHADAAFTAGRAALAVHALTAAPELLLPATADRLHQDYREPALGQSAALLRELRAAGVAAVVSGAGPTVLAFPPGKRALDGLVPAGFEVRALPVDRGGVREEGVVDESCGPGTGLA